MHRSAPAIALSLLLLATPAFAQDDISKVNGSITAASGQVHGDLSTVNGSIRLEQGSRVVEADTVNGSIRGDNDIQAVALSTVNGSIRIGTGARIGGNVETVNGSVFIDQRGIVEGNASTVNGSIGLVGVEVGGNVETVTGDITVGVGSRVKGHVKVFKPGANWLPFKSSNSRRTPRVIIGPNAVVDGELVFEREVTLYVHESARIGKVTGATPVAYSGARAPQED